MRTIHAEVSTYLFSRLAARDLESALPFVRAVIAQVLGPIAEDGSGPSAAAEREVGNRVIALVETAADTGAPSRAAAPPDAAAAVLASDPELLAAFFQNIDLLYECEFPDANAVSTTIMRAMESLGA